MNDFASKNYASKKNNGKAIARGFIMTMVFILGGLSLVVADHVGQSHVNHVELAAR